MFDSTNYQIVAPSPETRRLYGVAALVASLKLNMMTEPPWYAVKENSNGTIRMPRRVRGFTHADSRGELGIYVSIDQTPERLVNTVFHEVRHIKNFTDGYARGVAMPVEVNEGQADWFADSESPTGDYEHVLSELLSAGGTLCLTHDMPKTGLALVQKLAQYKPKLALDLSNRLNGLLKANTALAEIEDGWRSPREKQAEHARNAAIFRAELQVERRKRELDVESTLERARLAVEESRLAASKARLERESLYVKVPCHILTDQGKWIDDPKPYYMRKS